MARPVPRYRRKKIGPHEPRYVIRRSSQPGEVLGFAYVESWARRKASWEAERLGVAVVLLDEARRKLVARVTPSPEAIARRRARRGPVLTAGGQTSTTFVTLKSAEPVFLGEPEPLRLAEIPQMDVAELSESWLWLHSSTEF
jgi:hypothetical protein